MPKKPHVKAFRDAIAAKLGIKISQIYARAGALATRAQTKTEDGIHLLAAQSGINLNKYLPRERVAEIRNLLFQLNQHSQAAGHVDRSSKQRARRTVSVTIGKTFAITDPLLTDRALAEGKQMAEEVYPLLYVFENSVRELILRVMESTHGSGWWDMKVPNEIRGKVQERKAKEDKNPWHGRRGARPICYTDLDHLGRIVQNNWVDFKAILPSAQWLTQRLDEIGHSRNPVAHMNPPKRDDIQRIRVYFRDWQRLILAKKNLIPSR